MPKGLRIVLIAGWGMVYASAGLTKDLKWGQPPLPVGQASLTLGELGFATRHEGKRLVVTAIQPTSAAAQAEFAKADVILAVEGKSVATANEFQEVLAAFGWGANVKVRVMREALTLTLKLALVQKEAIFAHPRLPDRSTTRPTSLTLTREEIRRLVDERISEDPSLKGLPVHIEWQASYEEDSQEGHRTVPPYYQVTIGPLAGKGDNRPKSRPVFVWWRMDPQTGQVSNKSVGGPE